MDKRRSLKKACPGGIAYSGTKKQRMPPEALAAEQTAERSVGAEQTAPKGGIRDRGKGDAANVVLQGGAGTSNERSEVPGRSAGAAKLKLHQYDVFLNHRGPDVKKTFVAHLNGALERNGFRPFLDAKSIGQGRHVFRSIDKALKRSCVHVAVFSKRYAESKYCLDELCDMLRSEQPVLPVFYDVEPEALRRTEEGPFREGFEKHERRGRIAEVEKWKEALGKVADLRGFRMDEVNGDEEQLIRSIVKEVRRAIPPTLLGGKQRYGMGGRMKDVVKMLDGVSVLSLVGMGGIGKTTLAMEMYNQLVSHGQFEKQCFLKDVRSRLRVDALQLQRDLVRGLGHGDCDIRSTCDYERMFDALGCGKVLIIVDDIDDRSQFEALIPDIGKLGVGSKVVITSRYQDVVMQVTAGVEQHEVYDVPLLDEYDSRCLFNGNAFLSGSPSDDLAELAAKVADACRGHALSLEIIGASLFDKKEPKDKVIWLEAVKALQRNEDILGKLRSSYDSLPSDGERAMFKDIACMLIGMEEDVVMTIWESCSRCPCSTSKTPSMSLRRLLDRSLVKIDEKGKLRMHDVLRDMGRDIVEKEARRLEERTHLWDVKAATKVLSYRQSNSSVRGMCLGDIEEMDSMYDWERMRGGDTLRDVSKLGSMKELHLLIWGGCVYDQSDLSYWPEEIRWLQWRSCYFAKLPSPLKLSSLVVLDLTNSWGLTCLWDVSDDIELRALQILILTRLVRLEQLPENIGKSLPKLKRLMLNGCWKLKRLPDSIGHLKDLEELDLSDCNKLVRLPDGMVRLLSLKTLLLKHCEVLRHLPEDLGNMTNLETLDISECYSLLKLPKSMGGLKRLKMLMLIGTKIEYLPMNFGQLKSLTWLSSPSNLRSFPDSFGGLQVLSILHLKFSAMETLDCLGTLTSLREFHLVKHGSVTTLPKSFGDLKCLFYLSIKECDKLFSVEAWPEGLEHLELHCANLTMIPSFVGMKSLLHLDLSFCPSLKQIQGLECLTLLEHVDFSGCISVVGREIRIIGNNALRVCHLGGSKVGVAYNGRWLEGEPAKEIIDYWGNAIPILTNGMGEKVVCANGEWKKVVEASISSKAECVAFIGCFVLQAVHVGSFPRISIRIEVWRHGRLVVASSLFRRDCDSNDKFVSSKECCCKHVLWCTLRRNHEVVQTLQHGDQIHILARVSHGRRSRVLEGGVCVVHHEDEHFVFMENLKLLSKMESEELARRYNKLVLEDVDYE